MAKIKTNTIAQLRKDAGFTQKALAEALGITDKAVSKWERGLSLPDVTLLPRLSLLLGVDLSLLLDAGEKHPHEGWCGLIDLRESTIDLGQMVYDKPLVYFLLSHYLLSNVRDICVLCTEDNRKYLNNERFSLLGFRISYNFDEFIDDNLMILNRPCFLFGSDLTRQFQGAMLSNALLKLAPENMKAPFLFCPAKYTKFYKDDPNHLYETATLRTLGRGMVCMDLDDLDICMEAGNFVRMYQKNSKLLISSLEEISYRRGIIDRQTLEQLIEKVSYRKQLKDL